MILKPVNLPPFLLDNSCGRLLATDFSKMLAKNSLVCVKFELMLKCAGVKLKVKSFRAYFFRPIVNEIT